LSTVAQLREKTFARDALAVYLILAGVVATIAVGADFLDGTARFGYVSTGEFRLIGAAFAALFGGLGLDLTVGQKFTFEWLREAIASRRYIGKFLAISVELGLLTLVIREFQVGNETFYQVIAIIVFLGFFIHSLLPMPYRLPFFLLLSLLGIQAVFGWSAGAWLVGIGLALIAMCHLPIPFTARITLILATGSVLALARADRVIHAPHLSLIWPVLGSMFMFRLMVYLYDLRHDKTPVSIPATLSYFFLLPNVVFPLFPVVDYKMFRRTYYDADHQQIYQRGIEWMFRGTFQLILYRYVYSHLFIASSDVVSASTLIRYVLTNFALYLRVSGLFHLIVGILHLFGFHLPETHHRYFLSSSFTDFWRRINIYWKDFMMKLFFYPSYFRFKRWGATTALVLSTLLVFTCTWLLHSYQWFWLRGTFPLKAVDMIFWGILALLVVANSLYEAKYGRKRALGKFEWNLSGLAPLALRTAGTFSVICVLWSLWSADSVSEWTSMWHFAGKNVASFVVLMPLFFVAAVVSAGAQSGAATGKKLASAAAKPAPTIYRSILLTGASIILVLLIGHPAVSSRLNPTLQESIRDARVEGLNKHDATLLRRGYYEGLMNSEGFSSQLWEVNMRRPTYWPDINETEASRKTGDFLEYELRPFAGILFKNKPFSTNRWGMRDQDYQKQKPAQTYRYALLGASPEMGSGVADNETFESLAEARLNREKPARDPYARYEILNFSVGGYTPPQFVWILEHKVFDFQPDAVLYVAHENDEEAGARYLAKMVRAGVDIPYEPLKGLVRQAGIDRNTPMDVAQARLKPFQWKLLSWVYARVAEDCRQRGVQPVWILMGDAGLNPPQEAMAQHLRLAEVAGFTTIDLHDWFNNQNIRSVTVAEWDLHPNAEGQKVIADKLYSALRDDQTRLRSRAANAP
jgi:D-alanyl-lipoteichoic acid acyltransferase DltB (MBOAT superfamily)